jgi:hypothetical protein
MPVDFPSLCNAVPGCFLVLAPDYPVFTILAATNDYLRVTKTKRSEILGRPLFEVFPDNPGDPETQATHDTRASLMRAIGLRVPDLMQVQRHDIRLEGGEFDLSIVDDGKGFPQQAGTVQPPGSGWGLTIMRERAALAGGRFRLVTAPGEGTAVIIEIMKAP